MKTYSRLAIAVFFAVTAAAVAAPIDYSGKWTLDRKASKNLPPIYDKVVAHKIAVTQTPEKFTVAVDTSSSDSAAVQQTLDFDLTGKSVETETTAHTPMGEKKVPMTLKASIKEDGRVALVEERKLSGPRGGMTFTTDEVWELSPDGKTLTVHRKDKSPRGAMDYDMVFTRE